MHIYRSMTRVPDQTPLRTQLLQSGYDLYHSSPEKSYRCSHRFSSPLGGPKAHGALPYGRGSLRHTYPVRVGWYLFVAAAGDIRSYRRVGPGRQ